MASTVVLEVTPREPRGDPDTAGPELPADLAAALQAAGIPLNHGWSCHGERPWRMRWELTGTERVALGGRVEGELRRLGYEAHVTFWP